jgi:hypothetical protein
LEPLGEGRNPFEEIKGWQAKKIWQPAMEHTPGVCHISGDKLHTIGKTKKRKLAVWASEKSDGDLHRLASRNAEDRELANSANENFFKDKRGNYQFISQRRDEDNEDDKLVG